MALDDMRPARIAVAQRRTYASDITEDVLRRFGTTAETATYLCVLCAFWGLVVYITLTAALR
jgi:hypothetical protein